MAAVTSADWLNSFGEAIAFSGRLIVTCELTEPFVPATEYQKVSVPNEFVPEMYENSPVVGLTVAVPFAGGVLIENVGAVPLLYGSAPGRYPRTPLALNVRSVETEEPLSAVPAPRNPLYVNPVVAVRLRTTGLPERPPYIESASSNGKYRTLPPMRRW